MTAERKRHDEKSPESVSANFNPIRDIALVVIFLTRVPLSFSEKMHVPLANAAWAFPLAGVLTGGVGGGVFLGAIYLGSPHLIAILLGLAASILISGALHEDGLADVLDGFGGGATRDRKLEIMRDSRIGAYGVIGIVFSVSLRVASLYVLIGMSGPLSVFTVMISSAVFSRSILPAVMTLLPHARMDGLSKSAGRPGVASAVAAICLGIACVVASFYPGYPSALIPMLCSCGAVFLFGLIARRQIGGQTGDVIGAAQQISEITFLIVLTLTMGRG